MGEVTELLARVFSVMVNHYVYGFELAAGEPMGISPSHGRDEKIAFVYLIEAWADWAVCPCLYFFIKHWLLFPNKVPSLRVVDELLELPRCDLAGYGKDVLCNITN